MSSNAASKKRKLSEGGSAVGGGGATAESDLVKTCLPILKFIAQRPDAEPFLDPVDWEELGIPDYPEVIKNPMDLGTIRTKLEEGKYANEKEFAADVHLVWNNAKLYNQPGSGIYVAADALQKQFDRKMQKIITKKPSAEAASPAAKKKKPTKASTGKQVPQGDKVKFATLINQLTAPQIGKVVDMISKSCPEALNEEDEEDLEIEVDKIDRDTLTQLNAFCEQSINGGDAKKKKK